MSNRKIQTSDIPDTIYADRGPQGGLIYREKAMPDTIQTYVKVAEVVKAHERIEELEAALSRQGDNMAFVLNHMDTKNWYEKFSIELAEDRGVLK